MTDYRIWNRERSWPSDPHGYVFLARTVQRVGSAMFGEAWIGSEPTLRLIKATAYPSGELRVIRIPPRVLTRKPDPAFLLQVRKPIIDEAAAMRRLQSVYEAILTACQSGQLATAARPREGGKMTKLARSAWNTDRWLVRFEICEIDLKNPFEHPYVNNEGAWLFVTSKSLDKLLVSLRQHKIKAEELPHLSPYLRTMIAVASRVGVSPDNQVKKESLVTEIYTAWKEPTALSGHLAKVMATLIREPSSQLGRHKPSSTKKKGSPKA